MENIVELFTTLAVTITRRLSEQDIRIKRLEDGLAVLRDEKLDAPLKAIEEDLSKFKALTTLQINEIDAAATDKGDFDDKVFRALQNSMDCEQWVQDQIQTYVENSDLASTDDIDRKMSEHENDNDHVGLTEDAVKEWAKDTVEELINDHNSDEYAHDDSGGQRVTKRMMEEHLDEAFDTYHDQFHRGKIDHEYIEEAVSEGIAKHMKEACTKCLVDHYDEHHKPLVDISVLVAKVVGELTNKL